MTDAAFRDALEEYRLAFTADKHEPNNGPVPHCAGCDEVRRTRARVLALYAEASRGQVTMPERVWLTPDVFNRLLGFYRSGRGGEYDAAADTLNAHDTALRAALLAAEARVREVEAERDGLARHIDRRADGMDPLTQALRAERDALVPLARLGMLAREMYGMGELELDADLEGTAIKAEWDSLIAATDKARAILAREAGE